MAPKKKRVISKANRGEVARLRRKLAARNKLIQNLKEKLRNLRGLKNFQDLLMKYDLFNMNSAGRRFLLRTAKLWVKKARGRDYTVDEKATCLAIFKQNTYGYRFLSSFLPLPSPYTLTNALGKIPIWPGINNIIFDNLKERAKKLVRRDKICSLIFDEMSLKASLTYMSKYGIITGFENFGGETTSGRFADRVLMFMLRGIQSKWIQPIAFYFCESPVKTPQLVHCIKEVLQALFETGLKVQVTVCDHVKTNVAAINSLIDESRAAFTRTGREFRSVGFYFKDWEIIHIYDPPHLMKSIRNNLLTKDLIFTMDGHSFKASWTMILNWYEWDCYRMCLKLTDRHLIAEQIPKMKVKHAVQVLSRSVAAAVDNYACIYGYDRGTGKCCEFFDILFDSVNSRQLNPSHLKPLDCVLRTGSAHFNFWKKAQNILSTMKFVDAQGHSSSNSVCITSWSFNLRGFEALWNVLNDLGFRYVSLRNINLDPLINFFEQTRSHVDCNTGPTCSQFIGSFKTIMVNSKQLARKEGFNCEDDKGCMLTLLKGYLDDSLHIPISVTELPKIEKLAYLEDIKRPLNAKILKDIEDFVARRLGLIVQCTACQSKLMDSAIDPTKFTFIRDKQLVSDTLTRPTAAISVAFPRVCNIVWNIIPDLFHMREMRAMIINYINLHLDMSFLNCSIHNLSNVFISSVVNCLLFKWVESKNRNLYARNLKVGLGMDHVQRTAITKFKNYGKSRKLKVS